MGIVFNSNLSGSRLTSLSKSSVLGWLLLRLSRCGLLSPLLFLVGDSASFPGDLVARLPEDLRAPPRSPRSLSLISGFASSLILLGLFAFAAFSFRFDLCFSFFGTLAFFSTFSSPTAAFDFSPSLSTAFSTGSFPISPTSPVSGTTPLAPKGPSTPTSMRSLRAPAQFLSAPTTAASW